MATIHFCGGTTVDLPMGAWELHHEILTINDPEAPDYLRLFNGLVALEGPSGEVRVNPAAIAYITDD